MLKENQANLNEQKLNNNNGDESNHIKEESINISISNNSKKCKKNNII